MRALRSLECLAEKARLAAATPILLLISVLDSVSWLVSFCIDLVLGAALVAVLSIGRSKKS
ncbi:hypothetical protein [Thauera aromatica]|uniref:hypothetical protein n=1 Tax=Thauera aromatica TaxID=59405 RepID=UPI001FFCC7F8|nr:hypothetical protein [Thauera aromatica]MCK2097723.1 hypothetical protein [Thauera aromatica]